MSLFDLPQYKKILDSVDRYVMFNFQFNKRIQVSDVFFDILYARKSAKEMTVYVNISVRFSYDYSDFYTVF